MVFLNLGPATVNSERSIVGYDGIVVRAGIH